MQRTDQTPDGPKRARHRLHQPPARRLLPIHQRKLFATASATHAIRPQPRSGASRHAAYTTKHQTAQTIAGKRSSQADRRCDGKPTSKNAITAKDAKPKRKKTFCTNQSTYSSW